MAFNPIPYTYVPTVPRSKSTKSHRKNIPKQVGILNNWHIKPSTVVLDAPRQSVAAAADNSGDKGGRVRAEISIIGGSDDNDLPTIEELLYSKLYKGGYTTEDPSPDHTVEGVGVFDESSSIDGSRPVLDEGLGTSRKNPIMLVEDTLDTSAAELDHNSYRGESAELDAGIFSNIDTTLDSRASMPALSFEGCHDAEHRNSTETAQCLQLAELEALASDSVRLGGPAPRSSSEPLHGHSGTENLCTRRAISEAPTSYPSRPQSHFQLEEDEPLGADIAKEENERQRQEVVEEEDANGGEPPQEVNNVAAALTAKSVRDTHLSSEDESAWPARRQRPLPSRASSLAPHQDKTGSQDDSYSDDELSNTYAVLDKERKPHSTKRKRPSSSSGSITQKKRKHSFQQSSIRKPQQHRAERLFPSPVTSKPQYMGTQILFDSCNVCRPPRDDLPVLVDVTFRPYSPEYSSFIAVIWADCDRSEFSFGQFARLIEDIGHVGKIDDFTVKPLPHHLFLLTGFSQHSSSRLLHSRTVATATEACRLHSETASVRLNYGKGVDPEATTSEPLSSDNDADSSDGDPNLSSDDEGDSSEEEQKCPRTRTRSLWSELDEKRLLAYKKEEKSWPWIFRKFPGRTQAAVRMRWNMIRGRAE